MFFLIIYNGQFSAGKDLFKRQSVYNREKKQKQMRENQEGGIQRIVYSSLIPHISRQSS